MVLRWLKLATRCINQATLKILFKSVVGTFYASCCRSGSAVRCRLSWRYWNNVEWTWFVSLRDCLCYLLMWTELSLLFTRCRTYDTDYFPIGMGRAVMCYPADFLMINIKITIAPLVRLLACFYNSLVCTSAIHSCCSFNPLWYNGTHASHFFLTERFVFSGPSQSAKYGCADIWYKCLKMHEKIVHTLVTHRGNCTLSWNLISLAE